MGASAEPVRIPLAGASDVSGLWLAPPSAAACLVLAHGAGAGMAHPAMARLAESLAERDIATLRFQFPYMDRGSKRPDPPPVAHAAVRAATAAARERAGAMPLFAGGRSFGGRMTSQAQAAEPLPGVRGIVFFAFPLHPAGKPSTNRAEHLGAVEIPMLFLSGSADALAEIGLLQATVTALGDRATLLLAEGADHAFHVPAKSGRRDRDILAELLDGAAGWMRRVAGPE